MMAFTYVLITAARNEETFIEKTIQSVLDQTILPIKWVIVSDGSTDKTDEIIKKLSMGRDWIELVRMPERKERHFAGKALAFNAGYKRVKDLEYDFIGNLDADISFERDYFEFLLGKLSEVSTAGIGGTRYVENDLMPAIYSFRDVSGQCQIFKRECFEQVGGYLPSRWGGIDNIAVMTAQMKGWETVTFDEKTFFHHRPMGTAGGDNRGAMIKQGMQDYFLGNHPLWELFRVVYQTIRKQYPLGGIWLFYGYIKGLLSRMERPVSWDLINFHRSQQMRRLKLILFRFWKLKQSLRET